jgi:hypothetical protein
VNPEQELDAAHKAVCRAGRLLVVMLVKRKLVKRDVVEAVELLKFATNRLEALVGPRKGGD